MLRQPIFWVRVAGLVALGVSLAMLTLFFVSARTARTEREQEICALAQGIDDMIALAVAPRPGETPDQKARAMKFATDAHNRIAARIHLGCFQAT